MTICPECHVDRDVVDEMYYDYSPDNRDLAKAVYANCDACWQDAVMMAEWRARAEVVADWERTLKSLLSKRSKDIMGASV